MAQSDINSPAYMLYSALDIQTYYDDLPMDRQDAALRKIIALLQVARVFQVGQWLLIDIGTYPESTGL